MGLKCLYLFNFFFYCGFYPTCHENEIPLSNSMIFSRQYLDLLFNLSNSFLILLNITNKYRCNKDLY